MTADESYRGRLAPSPTGSLHVGIARTSLVAWLRARAAGGQLVMRMEDLDPLRVRPGSADAIVADLRWLGLEWDEGPDCGGAHGPYVQSERAQWYARAIAQLDAAGMLFECSCSRREVAEASSAPHGDLGPRYPGTCRGGAQDRGRPTCLRLRMPQGDGFVDGVHGAVAAQPPDDFIVRRVDGLFAYQLAVVVDDIAMGITEVVRGDDLLSSTHRQLALYAALGAQPPSFVHVPLVLGEDGRRLATRHGATAIADYRDAGYTPQRMVGMLAASLGLVDDGAELSAAQLVEHFALGRMPTQPTRWLHRVERSGGNPLA